MAGVLLDASARGVFVIAATPFAEDGALDLPSTDRLVEFYLERGATGLTVLGIMGEAPKLSAEEQVRFSAHVIARAGGRVPVVVGVSSPGFAAMRALTAQVMDAGAAGVMVAPPPGLRGDGGVFDYFAQVAGDLPGVPFVLQDYPQSNNVFVPAAVIRRIAEEIPACVMLKHEDWPGLGKLSALRADPTARRLSILVGNNAIFLPEELRRGADGAMSGFCFPEMMADVVAAHVAGDQQRAGLLHDAYLPLARYEQQPGLGLAVRKHVLAQRGAIASATVRAPRTVLSGHDLADLSALLARQERRLAELA